MNIFAVVGTKESGKTTTIEVLTRELTRRGYETAAVKHIPEADFTIDEKRKDTWRFAQSGAKTIVTVAPNEIATIEKVNTEEFSAEEILLRIRNADFIFLEGFKKIVKEKDSIQKIVTVKSAEEATEALRTFKPILAFTSLLSIDYPKMDIIQIGLFENDKKIADKVEEHVRRKREN